MTRTSLTHPLQTAYVSSGPSVGQIGITFCPGKNQPNAATGGWARDLDLDVGAIALSRAAAVVTLVEPHELKSLGVQGLGAAVAEHHMDWIHAPIADVAPPGQPFEDVWAKEGEGIRDRLRAGFDVVVHCKGGLGRAGTIAARLLVELGVKSGSAIDMVRVARPGAIETAAQEAHVRSIKAVPEQQPSTSAEAIADRARGALLGLAVGDAVGTTLEFKARDSYPRLTDMIGGGPFGLKPGQWTDDTSMALALADSLAAYPDLNEQDLLGRFVSWWRTGEYSCTGRCFDIGITVRQALARWEATKCDHCGSTDPMSAGNGSLMRLAPVAIRHHGNRAKLRDVAARQSKTIHAAAEAVDACVLYAEILADTIEGAARTEVLKHRGRDWAGAIEAIASGSWRGKHRDDVRGTGYVAQSLEASLWCVGTSPGYRDAVLRAANLGEDADTTAAITGQLAGAVSGALAIPANWLEKLLQRTVIERAATGLLTSRH